MKGRIRSPQGRGRQIRVPRPHGGQIRTTTAGGGDRQRGGGGGGRRRGQRRRMGLSWMAVVAKGAESGGLWLMKGVAGVGETATPMATRGGCQTPNIQS
ncbi:Os05g0291000 [Oryza sativa Japonica Group]|uniref:Os05g0291000 protein n=1 Tax=Oryza sativa subsp. japonica TaxID=39947 RepID=A0A0P0WK91_ORYSJ|nr:Os05g0291000 [Oryza sativa Japonica Group]